MTDYPTLALNDGRQIPQLGFGTWQIENDQAAEAVKTALDVGYWLVDTAAIYRNERGVGDGIGDWSDLFLQTKIWNESQGYDRTLKAADAGTDAEHGAHVLASCRREREEGGTSERSHGSWEPRLHLPGRPG